MSRDIFVQDLPRNARTTKDIPSDFRPRQLGLSSHRVIKAVLRLDPTADFTDPAWGRIEHPGYSVEVSLPQGDDVRGFALHVRGDGANAFISALLTDLDLRALDGDSAEGSILPANSDTA